VLTAASTTGAADGVSSQSAFWASRRASLRASTPAMKSQGKAGACLIKAMQYVRASRQMGLRASMPAMSDKGRHNMICQQRNKEKRFREFSSPGACPSRRVGLRASTPANQFCKKQARICYG
jgi:hypothetical protein